MKKPLAMLAVYVTVMVALAGCATFPSCAPNPNHYPPLPPTANCGVLPCPPYCNS